MAGRQPAQAKSAFGQLVDIANGRHKLSLLIPLALVAFDALLCIAVILKVPCKTARLHHECTLLWRD